MPYGQNDDSKMNMLLGGIRNAFGGGQPLPQEQAEMSEEEKRIRMAALQRLSSPQVDQTRVAALQKGFFGR